jgi:CubicO group peptidase (beta-lactamase class C family)
MTRFAHLFALLLAPVLASAAEPVTAQQIDAVVTAELKKQEIPGAAVAVIHKGKEVVAKGYGLANVEHKVPVTADTIFQAGSVGKQFTAAVILLLAEQKKLKLDDPITNFFPDAPFRWSKITVRHLLTHTSGLSDYMSEIDLQKEATEAELTAVAFGLKSDFAPGAKWSYSNTGYLLLGFIARKASGKFYGDILKDDVFAPLKMKSARVISEEDIVPNRSSGYRVDDGKLKNQEWVAPTLNTSGDGGLYVSLRDMVAWDKGVRDGAVLSAESWKSAFTPVKLNSGKTYPYGFGWEVDEDYGQLRHHHSGAWQGFTTYYCRYRVDDLSVIVLTNLAGADPVGLAEQVASLFNPKLLPPDEPIADKNPAVTKQVKELLAQLREGKATADVFADLSDDEFKRIADDSRKVLTALGEIESVTLHESRERGDDRHLRYRIVFKKKTLDLSLVFDIDKKVTLISFTKVAKAEK